MNELERQAGQPLQPSTTSGWGIADAAIVGVVGYAASVLFLLLSMFVVYSIPSLHSLLRFYQLDSGVYALVGLVGGILFAGPLVIPLEVVGEKIPIALNDPVGQILTERQISTVTSEFP